MTFIIKRDTPTDQYVSGYSEEIGIPTISNYAYHFEKKSDAQEIAKALNTFALLEDDTYRFEVYEVSRNKVSGTVMAEGAKNSAYNKRLGKGIEHEVEIEIEE